MSSCLVGGTRVRQVSSRPRDQKPRACRRHTPTYCGGSSLPRLFHLLKTESFKVLHSSILKSNLDLWKQLGMSRRISCNQVRLESSSNLACALSEPRFFFGMRLP